MKNLEEKKIIVMKRKMMKQQTQRSQPLPLDFSDSKNNDP